MTPADRAIVAAAEERDRAWLLPAVRNDAPAGYLAAYDRHDLLRIVREQEAAMKGVVAADYVDEPLDGDQDAAAEAEFLRPIR